MIRIFNKNILLIIILLVASFIRIYNLNNYPSGFQGDEASFFLNAQALKLNGHDEDNQFLPLYLRSFIDPKPALYSYLQIPFIYILGETHTSARIPAAIFGIISIYLVFLLIKRTINNNIGLISAALLAISPWHIILSRGSQEVILSFTFGMAALLFFFPVLKNDKYNIFSYFSFGIFLLLSMYSYHSAKIFLPILLLIIIILKIIEKKLSVGKSIILIMYIILIVIIAVLGVGFTRYNAVSIFNEPLVQIVLDEKIHTAANFAPNILIRLFNNKLLDYSFSILKNYGDYFSINYLFISGGQPQRFIIPFSGLFYIFDLVLFIIGFFYMLNKKKLKNLRYFFICWLLFAPLPGALTRQEIPSTIRTFPMIVPMFLIIAYGICAIYNSVKNSINKLFILIILIFLYLYGFSYFSFQYLVQQPNYHPWWRNYGDEQLPKKIMPFTSKYDRIYISTNQYVYFALDHAISIKDLQMSFPRRLQERSTYGKITFINKDCSIFKTKENSLYVVKETCGDYSKNGIYNKIGIIPFKDGNAEYVLYESANKK